MLLPYFVKSLVLSPMAQVFIILLGLAVMRWRRMVGKCIVGFGLLSIYLLATPVVSQALHYALENRAYLSVDAIDTTNAQAIVVLTGSQNDYSPEFGFPVSGEAAFTRVRYGAFLHNKTGLPLLISGGSVHGDNIRGLAATMAYEFKTLFEVKTRWLEEKSRNTAENAKFSYEILSKEGVTTILLVSSAYHLQRAQLLFERQGFEVIPAPTYFISTAPITFRSFLPGAKAMSDSASALHEWLGYIYYRVF